MLFILDSEASVCRVTETNTQDVAKRLMNADFHAANLRVTQSRCPSLVGISGIVLQETKNAFVLVTCDNQLKSECQHEFSVEVSGRVRLHGSSGVASMEQMEQLLPRAAQDHLRNSCKSDEIFWR